MDTFGYILSVIDDTNKTWTYKLWIQTLLGLIFFFFIFIVFTVYIAAFCLSSYPALHIC